MTRCSHAHRAAGKRSVGYDVELAGRRYDGFVRRLEFKVGRAHAQDCACTGLILGGVTALGPVRPVGLGKGCLSSAQGGPGVAS